MANRMYLIHALSSVHVGTGEGDSYVDLPLAREKVTNWPFLPGSGIKGVLSAASGGSAEGAREANGMLKAAFGTGGDDTANAGGLVFSDASLVLLPLRSVYGTFAYATSPLALRRFARDLKGCGMESDAIPVLAEGAAAGQVVDGAGASVLTANNQAVVYLQDFDITVTRTADAALWATKIGGMLFGNDAAAIGDFKKRFLILADDVFTFFCEAGTEIATRIHIDPATGTVANGQLWTEESLPTETVLGGLVWCDKVYHRSTDYSPDALLAAYCKGTKTLQIGGKATVGRGRVTMRFVAAGEGNHE